MPSVRGWCLATSRPVAPKVFPERMIMSTDKPRIGFVGLGLMGHGMARNLVAKGFPLTVRLHKNRKPAEDILAAGAKEVKTYAELARGSDVVILCVTGSPQIEEIVYGENGILSAARDGLVVVDTSTAEPSSTAKIRDDLAKKGTKYVDAPLARTPKEAEEGRLNTMVGADDATFARLKPVFSAYCENVIHVGGPGHGHMVKLVNNFIAMSIATATAEACAACAKAGVSIRKLHEIVSAGGVNSGIFQMMVGKMLESGDLTGLKFTLSNAMKDLRYYTHFVEALPSPAIIGEAVHQSMVNANLLGFGDKYVASLLEAQEKLAGVNIVRQ
jgi:3-hydroxyisobutyrate dehydrogenase-like beta-hydroxyacid dehydrogenase